MMKVDLRSDTITQPTAAMLEAMFAAKVGDDVFGEDPAINELEQRVAKEFGFEAALFCASGTMANQIAIKVHTQPGAEVICEAESHVFYYEGGGIALNSSAQARPIKGENFKLTPALIEEAINPDDVHKAKTSLVCLENTLNRGGGKCYYNIEIELIKNLCNKYNLPLHLDGARLWNAAIATKTAFSFYGKMFDSIALCFNKGMGCPVGSILLGNKEFIAKARRIRKVFGGGWRQAGYLAQACLFALDNNYNRLITDHLHAKNIAEVLKQCSWVKHVIEPETNILLFDIDDALKVENAIAAFAKKDILCFSTGKQRIRFVFHLHIENEAINYLVNIIKNIDFQ
jgi:threonine aldolase